MPWKMDENGSVAMEDGNPIWESETGDVKPVDYVGLTKRLSEVNNESRSRKEKLREYEARYAPLADAGIEDIPAYLAESQKALEMMKNAPDRDKDIEEQVKNRLEAVSAPLKAQITAKEKIIADREKALSDVTNRYHAVTVKTDVLNSKVVNERIRPEVRTFIQRELMRAGTVSEDGNVVYRTDDGEVIYGEDGGPASVDEAAIAIMKNLGVDPAANLMSQDTNSGSGAQPSAVFRGAQIKNPWAKDSWNVTAQGELYQKNPAEAQRLMQAAHQSIPTGL